MKFGWDISTSIIGLAIFNDNGKLVKIDKCDLRKEETNLIDKGDVAFDFIKAIHFDCHEKSEHFIEDRLAGFTRGKTNQNTMMKLCAFNAMVSWMIWHEFQSEGTYICHIHPSTVKAQMKKLGLIINEKQDKKDATLELFKKLEPNIVVEYTKGGNPKPGWYDVADSWSLVKAGLLIDRQGMENKST